LEEGFAILPHVSTGEDTTQANGANLDAVRKEKSPACAKY